MSVLASAAAATGGPFRVLVVDDSAIVRGMMSRWLGETSDLAVVGVVADGAQAVKKIAEVDAELCILDIEMPVMNGLEALPQLLRLKPGLRVVMASTLTVKGGEVALRALDLGAADYIAKPSATGLGGANEYRDELIGKLRRLGEAGRRRPALIARPALATSSGLSQPAAATPAATVLAAPRPRRGAPSLTVIASSTGGPPALRDVLHGLGPGWPTPIMIVQHMPAAFTKVLAEHLDKTAGVATCEASAGQVLRAGHAYVAPGDWHMTVAVENGASVVRLNQAPAENWCRPAADPLFRSAAQAYRDRVLAIVLTGMGSDGREGARALVAEGAYVIVQDEATSVVWGMPGAVAAAGAAHAVKPLGRIAEAAWSLVRGTVHAS